MLLLPSTRGSASCCPIHSLHGRQLERKRRTTPDYLFSPHIGARLAIHWPSWSLGGSSATPQCFLSKITQRDWDHLGSSSATQRRSVLWAIQGYRGHIRDSSSPQKASRSFPWRCRNTGTRSDERRIEQVLTHVMDNGKATFSCGFDI